MLQPLFNRFCEHVGWFEIGKNIYDIDLNWVAFIYHGHAWSQATGNWLGPINGLNCLDRSGKVVAWNPAQRVAGLNHVPKPLKPIHKPVQPVPPLRNRVPFPTLPPAPVTGWSPLTFSEWIQQ